MIRSILILFSCILFQAAAFAQLKKSYYGKYTGKIARYEINTGMEKVNVGAVEMEVQLSSSELLMKIGNQEKRGTWTVLLDTKSYYILVGKMENQLADERLIVYKKGKKISREGIRPQPDAMLEKVKK